jgi:hypothetical protein
MFRLKSAKLFTLPTLAIALLCGFASASFAQANGAATAPTDGTWVKGDFMYMEKPPAGAEWIAKTLMKYGPQPPANMPPGGPVIYQVFQIIPNSRTIIAAGDGQGCIDPPNGINAKPYPAICPLYTITVYADGSINTQVSHPGCYFHSYDPSSRDGTYYRFDPSTGSIQSVTAIGGSPVSACNASTHP